MQSPACRRGQQRARHDMSEDDFVKLENVAVTYGRDAAHSVTALDETNLRIGRGDGIAFQNPTMLPWLKIRDNVMLPLKIVPPFRQEYRAKKNTEFKDRAEALLADRK